MASQEELGRIADAPHPLSGGLGQSRTDLDAELIDSRERYHALFDSIDEGFCIIERIDPIAGAPPDFRYIEANPAFEMQSGLTGVVGKTIKQVVPDEADDWQLTYDAILRTGQPIRFERALRAQERVLELYAFRVEDNAHRRVAVIFKDITARKHGEAVLRESEERYRTIFDSGPVAVCSCDASGVIQKFNRRATELWGRVPALGDANERFCGSFKLVRPDGTLLPHEECPMAGVVSGDTPEVRDTEVIIERPDGSRVTVVVNIRSLKDQYGEVSGAINCFYDITERSQLEAAHRDSETRYRRLFESAKDGILILDFATGKIVDANPFMTELLGYSSVEFNGKELWEIGLFADRSASEAAVRQLQETGYIRFENLPLESNNGRRVEVEIVGNAYQEGQQRVIQCNVRDITERSRLERTTQEQAVALADLHHRKDEFLAMLSHELRTPLAPIASAVEILRLQPSESPVQQNARKIIERQVAQLKHLIDDLLEVSRITTGKVHLREAQIAVHTIVEAALEAVRPLMDWRRHELSVLLPSAPIWLKADAARLEQVVVNLLTNAAKYTDEGGHIWLSVETEGDRVVLRVRDTGVGIAPELLPHIFDLFTQAERSLDRAEGGLGIGLCLVRRLVELHGGTVEAHSVQGRGSEFVVRLPAIVPLLTPIQSLGTEVAQPREEGHRVLVVDDNVDTAQSLAMLLTASGHQVRIAHDGFGAIDEVYNYRPQMVVLDIGLPGLSGFEVATRIREQFMFKDVVLVALTGYGQERDRQLSLESGFDHHLVKPASFDQLEKILCTIA